MFETCLSRLTAMHRKLNRLDVHKRHHRDAVVIFAAAAGFYYYFKTILAMYTTEGTDVPALSFSVAAKSVAGALALAILILGVYPKPLQGVLTSDPPGVAVQVK